MDAETVAHAAFGGEFRGAGEGSPHDLEADGVQAFVDGGQAVPTRGTQAFGGI